MTGTLSLRLLGPLEVERAGAILPLGSTKQRRLLTELAIADGATVSVDRLIGVLWGDDPPAAARNGLQTHVARLRDALGPGPAVLTRPGGYALNPEVVTVDADRFVAAVAAARATVDHDPTQVVTDLTEALRAWRGDAHGEFDDSGAQTDAARLHGLRAEARELLASAHARRGDHTAELAELDRLVAENPLRETAVIARSRCLAALRRLPDALAALRAYRQRLADELGLDPSPPVARLEEELLRGDTPPAAELPQITSLASSAAPVAPPRLGTATIGRHDDLERISAALEVARVVTLVGPGGVGKTRLATEIGRGAARAAWIDLVPARPDELLTSLAEGLGIAALAGRVPEQVLAAAARFPGLVVIDNCEHVIDEIADVVDQVLAADGDVRILTTSRERLDVSGEIVVPVAPLPIPDPAAATSSDAAVNLFLDRLVAAGGDAVSPAEAALVVAAVDGLPLGIELAAARAVTLPIAGLLERLHARLDVLTGSRRRHGDRHRTLTSVIAWSYDLLEPLEQVLFRRLATFTATFRLEDVERICADEALPVAQVADALSHLVDQSMVTLVESGRYRLLEPLRLFAEDRLADSGDTERVHARQRDAALALAALADEAITGPDEIAVCREIEWALPDLRAVHARAVAVADGATVARLAARLCRFAYLQARTDVLLWGAALAEDDSVDPTERARALGAGASGAWMSGDIDLAGRLGAAAAACLPLDPWSETAVLEAVGDVRMAHGDLASAAGVFERCVDAATRTGHDGLLAQARASLAVIHAFQGDLARARTEAEAAFDLALACGAPGVQSLAQYAVGEALADTDPDAALVALEEAGRRAAASGARFIEGIARTAEVALRGRHGDPRVALERYREALRIWLDSGAESMVQTTLRNLIVLFSRIGGDAAAVTLERACRRVATRPSYGEEHRRLVAAVAASQERLDADAVAAATAAASGITGLREASEWALGAIDTALDQLRT
jgi:predicted ATPase/DNA-binding SARP family transcriptional activator